MIDSQPSDHFAPVADAYARYRPRYPHDLFAYLSRLPARRNLAWDCGAGSGQATIALARYFDRVIATDVSAAQLARAAVHPRVEYRVAAAEASGLATRSVDLITVAQALHWFDLDAFYAEARRVLTSDGVVAVWTYGEVRLADAAIDAAVKRFYHHTIGAFWPPERRHVAEGYRNLAFPFAELLPPAFRMEVAWTLSDFLGYLRTWSAVARYVAAHGADPVEGLREELLAYWTPADSLRRIHWPLSLRVGVTHDPA